LCIFSCLVLARLGGLRSRLKHTKNNYHNEMAFKRKNSRLYSAALLFIAAGVLLLALRGFLGPVFSGGVILPQSFNVGSVSIHYYGLILALAVLTARFIALRRAQQYGLTRERADEIIFIVILAGVLGARLYHVASSWPYYLAHPQLIFAIWRGGLSIYGALLGGAAALAIIVWRQGWARIKFNNYLNWLTFSFLAGQIMGRFGNLFNYEAFGAPTNLPWKMFVPAVFRPEQWAGSAYFHPWFLYESLANLLIFFGLLCWKRGSSRLFLWYALLYNVVRLLLEFLRVDSTFIGPIRLNAVVSAILALGALVVLIKFKDRKSEIS
jgi:phosphatidylglycerol:prolipoprotein diacylglycerol transferase